MLPPAPPGVSPYFYTMFATKHTDDGREWYKFSSIDAIPPEIFYEYPTRDLDFRRAHGHSEFEIITLDLKQALDALPPGDGLTLNPARWCRVRQDLSAGWTYMPWMGSDEGKPSLIDGRHRIVAMMKFLQLETAPFVVESCYAPAIRAWFGVELD